MTFLVDSSDYGRGTGHCHGDGRALGLGFVFFPPAPPFFFFKLCWLHCLCCVLRGLSGCGVGAFCHRARALEPAGSLVQCTSSVALRHVGILVPRLWVKPISSELEGGFLTTGPPGKSASLGSIFMGKILQAILLVFSIPLIFFLLNHALSKGTESSGYYWQASFLFVAWWEDPSLVV